MTDTPPDEVLIEAARRLGWLDNPSIEYLREVYSLSVMFVGGTAFRALCDTLVELGWKPPVDRKMLCAREAAMDAACGREGLTDVELALRAIELWESGYGKD